jgi:CRP-like cAMP-binding protein
MTDFLMNQLLGLNGLVSVSNLIFLVAFSVRDVLHLRVLSIIAYVVIMPFYYLQPETLWVSIFWGSAFIIINLVRVVLLLLERRPVILSPEEETLYGLAFTSMEKREFLKLLSLATWADCSADERLLEKGKKASEVMIMLSGKVQAVVNDTRAVDFQAGQLIGSAEVLGGLGSPVDIVTREPSRVVKWNVERVREFAASRPDLRATLAAIVNADLAGKLRQATSMVQAKP